ncbi:DUF4132 domain-containing protein [Nocardioides litoris]|uniref:DUF4132 domain-containing protein n=1 Tax=Nocardioides litoris TaxID=1926648 RepID=UPI00111D42C6|nr:DUF4132 domain-containing protein [Nocardioides litoris]
MRFFRRQASGDRPDEGPVPRGLRSDLRTLLEGLDDGPGSIGDFVVTGSDPRVLSLACDTGPQWLSQLLHDRGVLRRSEAGRRWLAALGGPEALDPAVVHRWGRVLEAADRRAGGGRSWGQAMAPVGGQEWPELVLRHAVAVLPTDQVLPFTLDDLARVLRRDDAGPRDLLLAALRPDTATTSGVGGRPALLRLPGFADLLLGEHELVAEAAGTGPAEARASALGLLAALDAAGLASYAEVVVRGAVAQAKAVRSVGGPLLDRLPEAVALEALRGAAVDGRPEERARALQLLHERVDDDEHRAWAVETAAADRAAGVRRLVDAWAAAATAVDPEPLALPPRAAVDWAVPRGEARRAADEVVRAATDRAVSMAASERRWAAATPGARPSRPDPPPGGRVADDIAAALVDPRPVTAAVVDLPRVQRHAVAQAVDDAAGSLPPSTSVQLLRACGLLDGSRWDLGWTAVVERAHRVHGLDLDTAQQLLDGVGADGFALLWGAFSQQWGSFARDWSAEDVWVFVARNLDAILADVEARRGTWDLDDEALFAAAATLPQRPARLTEHLYATALGRSKTLRGPAQEALAGDPARTARATAALADGKSEVRSVAAQWLGRLGDPTALPALQGAWRREKHDVVRGHLLDALEALGEDVATYLDLDDATARAEKVLARGLPAPVAWLSWDAVPEARWASSGRPVPRVVLQWLVATAVKARSPEPDAVLRRWAEQIEDDDRHRLGRHLLEAWIAEDTAPISSAEAAQRAAQQAVWEAQWAAQQPGSAFHGRSQSEIAATLLPAIARTPAGSATAAKGLLAVVAATAGGDVVPVVERYLQEWYGQRAAQGKALLAMLSWVDHPAATQLVLSVGSRFRTRSFQVEATRLAEELAERRGWTLDELADRTVPTAGLDASGVLELSYGPRTFTARLQPDLTLVLVDPDGRPLKALPAPRRSDDEEQATAARKALAAARREVKAVAAQQTGRLHEALCTERSWPAEDWRRYLLEHPLVGPAARRLVWAAVRAGDPGTPVTTFRPLDDGTLTDVDDEPVDLDGLGEGLRVRLAHDSLLPAEEVTRWLEHLADYEVHPLFEQLGKPGWTLPDDARRATEVADLEGHLVETFALRGRATRLGWTRGPTEDAGWFYSYRKRFPSLGLVAQVGFTGTWLPEEQRTVALTRVTYWRELPDDSGETPLALGDVPPVLLSETVGDARRMAADGPGFTPDWQTRTQP